MRSIIFIFGLFYSLVVLGWDKETSDNIWRNGCGQGVAEAQVTRGSGNEIYRNC